MDDSLQRFIVNSNADDGKLELTPRWEPDRKTTLSYCKHDVDRLVIECDFFGDNLPVVLHRILNPKFLVNRGFHWISEKPYNR